MNGNSSNRMERAFLAAYDMYADALFRHIFFRVHDRELAHDLLADTFARGWQYIEKGKRVDNMRAFLYKTAHNLVIDEYRKHHDQSLDAMAEDGFDPRDHGRQSAIYDAAEVNQFLKALENIPKEYREVVLMRYVDDMSPEDIAEVLDENANTVSVRIHRGVAMVRKELGLGENEDIKKK